MALYSFFIILYDTLCVNPRLGCRVPQRSLLARGNAQTNLYGKEIYKCQVKFSELHCITLYSLHIF